MRAALAIATLGALLASGSAVAGASTTGVIAGSVVNARTGAPVAGAKVTAASDAESTSTISDAHGNFAFVSLIPGTYHMLIERDGYDVSRIVDIPVLADNTTRIVAKAMVASVEIVHLDGYRLHEWGQGISAGLVSDVYRYRGNGTFPWSTESPLPNIRLIEMTPGITFGAGAPVMR